MSTVFISYRRQDSAGHARALYDRLRGRFGESVFMDVDGIEPGVDFVEVIEQAIGDCRVLLVVIGREWAGGAGEDGRRRLDDPHDFIRLEVATALKRKVVVIPVLVEGAVMPRGPDLPEDLSLLARRQAIELRDTRWDADVDALAAVIEKTLGADDAATVAPSASAAPAPSTGGEPAQDAAAARRSPARTPQAPPEPAGASARPTPRRRALPMMAVVAGALVLLAAIGAYFWPAARTVAVPELVGLPLDQVGERLRAEGLEPGERTSRKTREAPPQHVLEQIPAAGSQVRAGTKVAVVVAERVPLVVPELVGKTLDDARTELTARHLRAGKVTQEATDKAPPDTVLRASPAPGTEVEADSAPVDLVVAMAPDRRVIVPELAGLALDEASERVQRAGLKVRRVAGQPVADASEFQVLGQQPAPGEKIDPGDTVTLTFNPRFRLTVPNVVGQPIDGARAALAAAGLTVGRVTTEPTERTAANVVLAQTPGAGTEVGKDGARVELRVATAPPRKPGPPAASPPPAAAPSGPHVATPAPPATPAPAAARAPEPARPAAPQAPTVRGQGEGSLRTNIGLSLAEGELVATNRADVSLAEQVSFRTTTWSISPLNRATIGVARSATREACAQARYSNYAIPTEQLGVGSVVCVKSASGALGALEVKRLPRLGYYALDLTYVVW